MDKFCHNSHFRTVWVIFLEKWIPGKKVPNVTEINLPDESRFLGFRIWSRGFGFSGFDSLLLINMYAYLKKLINNDFLKSVMKIVRKLMDDGH